MHEKLRQHLADKAKEIRVKVPDRIPEKAPGGRAALGTAALAMALVLAVGITVPLLSGDDEGALAIAEIAAPETTVAAETTTTTTMVSAPPPTGVDILRPGELPAVFEGPRLIWRESDFDGSFVRSMVEHNGTLYALADNVSHSSVGLWTSIDGLQWSSVELGAVLETDNAYIDLLAAGDSGLVAVGAVSDDSFGPEYRRGGQQTLVWTSPDGQGWSSQELVAELPATLSPYTKWYVYSSGVATSGGTVVVMGNANQDIDYAAVEADFFPQGLSENVSFEGDGIWDYGSGPPVKILDAEELGIPPGRPLWEEASHPIGWVSQDGGDFRPLDLQVAFDGLDVYSVVATPSGFAAAGRRIQDHDVGEPVLWTSPDGISWSVQPVSLDDSVEFYDLRPWGDRFVTVGWGPTGGSRLYISSDGETWQPAGGSAFEPGDGRSIQMYEVSAGPLGIFTFGEAYHIFEPPDLKVYSGDKYMIIDQTDENPFVTIIDNESGEVLFEGEVDSSEVFRFSGESATATIEDPETGELLFEFTLDDLSAAQAEVEQNFESTEFDQPSMALLYSADGQNWNRESFDDLFGFNGYGSIIVMEDRVIVVLDREFGGTTMFVGTPQG